MIVILPKGNAQAIYSKETMLILNEIGTTTIRRASAVESDASNQWWADLAPVGGPVLGPFAAESRDQALAAEVAWLNQHLSETKV